MSRIKFLVLSISNLFLLIGVGVGLLSAETPTPQPATINTPLGDTLDCLPTRKSSPITATTTFLVGTIWRENNTPDGIRAQAEARLDNITIIVSCSSDDENTNDTVVTTSGLLTTGVYSIPINANGAPTDTQYTLRATLPQNHYFTWQNIGNDESIDSDVSTQGRMVLDIPSNITTTHVQIDMGLTTLAPNTTLTGIVWEDTQLDGLRDNNEPTRPNIPIGLTCPNALPQTSLQVTTEQNGAYAIPIWFATVTANQLCQLSITPPVGYKLTEANVGNDDTIDSDFATDTFTTSITVGSSSTTPAQDAGITPLIPLATHLTQQQTNRAHLPFALTILLVCGLCLFTHAIFSKHINNK